MSELEKGKLHYDSEGKVICHICGRSFHSLDQHINMSHEETVSEYKQKFGLNANTGLRSELVKQKLRDYVAKNYDKVVTKNLKEKGKSTQFVSGNKGRTKDKIRSEEMNRLKNLVYFRSKDE